MARVCFDQQPFYLAASEEESKQQSLIQRLHQDQLPCSSSSPRVVICQSSFHLAASGEDKVAPLHWLSQAQLPFGSSLPRTISSVAIPPGHQNNNNRIVYKNWLSHICALLLLFLPCLFFPFYIVAIRLNLWAGSVVFFWWGGDVFCTAPMPGQKWENISNNVCLLVLLIIRRSHRIWDNRHSHVVI